MRGIISPEAALEIVDYPGVCITTTNREIPSKEWPHRLRP